MIEIEIQRSGTVEDGYIDLRLRGHAGYAPVGSDIVCAGISALYETLLASIESFTKAKIGDKADLMSDSKDDWDYIKIIFNLDNSARVLLRAFCLGVHRIASTYPEHVRVTEKTC